MRTVVPRRTGRRVGVLAIVVALSGGGVPGSAPFGVAPVPAAAAASVGGPFSGRPFDDSGPAVDGTVPLDPLPPEAGLAALAARGTAFDAGSVVGSTAPAQRGIPAVVVEAYRRAAAGAPPACRVGWPVLAAIGRVESGHANGGRVDAAGRTRRAILGPPLDGGPGRAAIRDTDGGALDGDTVWDRAVGPMQFIPSTWRTSARDGSGDGTADPHNVYDAAAAAAAYLCAGGRDLSDPAALAAAVLRYNRSQAYVRTVLAWARYYATGVQPTAPVAGPAPSTSSRVVGPAPGPVSVRAAEGVVAAFPQAPPVPLQAAAPPPGTPPSSTPPSSTPPSSTPPSSTPPSSTPPPGTPPPPADLPPAEPAPTSPAPSSTAPDPADTSSPPIGG